MLAHVPVILLSLILVAQLVDLFLYKRFKRRVKQAYSIKDIDSEPLKERVEKSAEELQEEYLEKHLKISVIDAEEAVRFVARLEQLPEFQELSPIAQQAVLTRFLQEQELGNRYDLRGFV
jgi:hypothetical protein